MSNNYLQFSEELVNLTNEEAEWINNNCEKLTDNYDSEISINWTVEEDEEHGNKKIWFYSDEYADVEEIAKLIHCFFKEFRPTGKDVFTITWSDSCDRLRLSVFGGGYAFICKDYYVIKNVYEIIEEEKKVERN